MQNMVNFEDLIRLFSFNPYNRGILRMDLDEASYLYKLVKQQEEKPRICEIGTYKGGSTCLMACAGANIDTFDNYSSKTFTAYEQFQPKDDVIKLLKEYGVKKNVNVYIGDSRIYDNTILRVQYDILFIDGDHSYEGVKADYNHWIHTLRQGGHLLFHDSCVARENATGRPDVIKFMKEISYKKLIEVGSITHFIKE